MKHRKTLLAAGIAAILGVAAVPHVQRAVEERRIAREGAQRALWIELKEKELACLERLRAGGFPEGMNVGAEIARCRALAVDPATGEPVRAPGEPDAP
jgi:hypothetical protein